MGVRAPVAGASILLAAVWGGAYLRFAFQGTWAQFPIEATAIILAIYGAMKALFACIERS